MEEGEATEVSLMFDDYVALCIVPERFGIE